MNKKNIEEYIKKNYRLLLVVAIALLVFHKYIIIIVLFLLFGFMGMYSLKVTRMVPNISVETITSSSILFGYVWGWKLGLAFGVIFGLYGYTKISFLKLTTIVNALFMGLAGVTASLFASLGYSFWWSFFLSYIIRANLGFFVFSFLQPNVVENVMHSYGDAIFNVLIVYQLMQAIYSIVVHFA
jgi:hypothetical protein